MTRTAFSQNRPGISALARALVVAWLLALIGIAATRAQAQASPASPAATAQAPSGEAPRVTLRELFLQSFDLFTVLLVAGSLAGWTIIIICVIEIRRATIAPEETEQIISQLAQAGRWSDLRAFVAEDDAFVSRVVRSALDSPGDDMNTVRETAELAASEESSRWFRKIEPLNVIGNLGPLLGLAGTVWGMIIAFAALGQSGGQASPANLSLGISKALFHTLLGLLLAVPCLTIFGFYRSFVDKLCTHAMVAAADLIEMLPADSRTRGVASAQAPSGAQRAPTGSSPPASSPRPIAAAR